MKAMQRIVRGRAVPSLVVSASSSVAGLVVAVAVARTSSIGDTGRFGIAVGALLIVTALARSAVTDPLVADARPEHTRLLGRASLIGLVGGLALTAVGAATGSVYLVVAGLAAHGLTVRECVRAVSVATGVARVGVLLEGSLAAASLVGLVGTLIGVWDGTTAYVVWAASGAVLGYVAAATTRSDVRPGWTRTPVPTARSVAFASDTLIGSGVVQLVTWIATAIGGLSVAAALRGAGTLAGPVTVGLAAARAVLIPRAVHHLGTARGLRWLGRDAAIMAGLALPVLVALACVPGSIGSALLGDTWALVAPILPLTAVELLFQLVAAVPEAAHRALGRGRRILVVRCGSAVVRLPAVIVAAHHGIGAVVLTAAAVTVISAVAWWWSLATLVRPSTSFHARTGVATP